MTTAIILAGGLGTRLRSAVPDLPKPMAPVAGRPFLAHVMDHWIGQGVRRFVLAVGYRHEIIVRHFGSRYRSAVLDYAVESSPRGTGGALLEASGRLPAGRPALLLNGDTYFDVPLPALAARANQLGSQWCLALVRREDRSRYMGVDIGRDGRVQSLQAAAAPLANAGAMLFDPLALTGVAPPGAGPLSLESELLPRLLAQGQCFGGLELPGPFIDIGVPADYRRAHTVLPGCGDSAGAPSRVHGDALHP